MQPFELAETYDFKDTAQKIADKTPEREIERSGLTGVNPITGYLTFETVRQKGKNIDEMGNAFEYTVMTDPKAAAYIDNMAFLSGQDRGALADNIIGNYKANVIPNYGGVTLDSKKYDYKEDYRYKMKLDDAYQKGRILFKNSLENPPEELGVAKWGLQAPVGKQYQPLDKERTVGLEAGKTWNPLDIFYSAKEKNTISYFMTLGDDQVNKRMLESIKKSNPNWNDGQVIDEYNKIVKSNQSYSDISYIPYRTSSTQIEESRRSAAMLKAGAAKVIAIDANGKKKELTQEERIRLGNSILDDKGNLQIPAAGKALGYSGHVPGMSTMFVDPSGTTYYVESNDYATQNIYSVIDKGFEFIRNNDAVGTPMPYMDRSTGKVSYIVGTTVYDNGKPVQIFYPSFNQNGKWQIDTSSPFTRDDNTYANAADIEMMLVGQDLIRKSIPRKTKSEFESETGTFLNQQ